MQAVCRHWFSIWENSDYMLSMWSNVCRSMIPQVRNLVLECDLLEICISCLVSLSYVLKFGPVLLAENRVVALAQKRNDISVRYRAKVERPAGIVATVIMIKYNNLSDFWKPQNSNLCFLLDREQEFDNIAFWARKNPFSSRIVVKACLPVRSGKLIVAVAQSAVPAWAFLWIHWSV